MQNENKNENAVQVQETKPQVVYSNTSIEVSDLKVKNGILRQQAIDYAKSTIVPVQYQNNPANCFIAIEMAERMGASPFQVMQSLYIIQGRPSWSSSFIIAAINQSGKFKSPLSYDVKGKASDMTLECTAYCIGFDGKKYEGPTITMDMAKAEKWLDKPGSKWRTMPELMIRYRAAAFFGRLYCPDLLLGILTKEENEDIIEADVTPINEDYKYNTQKDVAEAQAKATAKFEIKPEDVMQMMKEAKHEPVKEAPEQHKPTEDDPGF